MQRQKVVEFYAPTFAAFALNLFTTGLRLWLYAAAAFAALNAQLHKGEMIFHELIDIVDFDRVLLD
jgi:hypothetical protein